MGTDVLGFDSENSGPPGLTRQPGECTDPKALRLLPVYRDTRELPKVGSEPRTVLVAGRQACEESDSPMRDIGALLLAITTLLAYLNHRFVGLSTSIGVMAIAMSFSFALIGLDRVGFGMPRIYEESLVSSIDFGSVLLQGRLSI